MWREDPETHKAPPGVRNEKGTEGHEKSVCYRSVCAHPAVGLLPQLTPPTQVSCCTWGRNRISRSQVPGTGGCLQHDQWLYVPVITSWNYAVLASMEPVPTCVHYNYPQSITSPTKTVHSEILYKIPLTANSHAPRFWSSNSLPTRLSISSLPWLSIESRKLARSRTGEKESVESRGKASMQHLACSTKPGLWPILDTPRSPKPAWKAQPWRSASPHLPSQQILQIRWNLFWTSQQDLDISLPELSPPICGRCGSDLFNPED